MIPCFFSIRGLVVLQNKMTTRNPNFFDFKLNEQSYHGEYTSTSAEFEFPCIERLVKSFTFDNLQDQIDIMYISENNNFYVAWSFIFFRCAPRFN